MKTSSLIKILIGLILVVLLCLLNIKLLNIINPLNAKDYVKKTYEGNNGNINYPYFKDYGLDKKIAEYVDDLKVTNGDIDFKLNIVDDKYLSLLFILPNNYFKSYLINLNNLKEEDISVVFKDNNTIDFGLKIAEMLVSKYPAFIYSGIINSEGETSYLIENNQIMIYFFGYNIKPTINEPIFIKLNYNEIYESLKIGYTLDSNYVNENIYTLDPNKKTIAITFDDGPSGPTTREIFNTLNDNKASATFFMLGNKLENYIPLITDIINSDSEVGTHSYKHQYLVRLSYKQRSININKPTEFMAQLFNSSPVYFRPPYGSINSRIKKEINIPIIMWSVDPQDWNSKDAKTIKNDVLRVVKDGDIILLHDIFPTTVEAVKMLLPELYARGYQVVSVSKLAELKGVTLSPSKSYRSIK